MSVLQVTKLRKRFGGLVATDDVSLTVEDGEIHALIGPNGAGKSTLINQLCGELAPDFGRIMLAGRDITKLPVPARVALGLGRTFQVTNLLDDATCRENIAMAVQARDGLNFVSGMWCRTVRGCGIRPIACWRAPLLPTVRTRPSMT